MSHENSEYQPTPQDRLAFSMAKSKRLDGKFTDEDGEYKVEDQLLLQQAGEYIADPSTARPSSEQEAFYPRAHIMGLVQILDALIMEHPDKKEGSLRNSFALEGLLTEDGGTLTLARDKGSAYTSLNVTKVTEGESPSQITEDYLLTTEGFFYLTVHERDKEGHSFNTKVAEFDFVHRDFDEATAAALRGFETLVAPLLATESEEAEGIVDEEEDVEDLDDPKGYIRDFVQELSTSILNHPKCQQGPMNSFTVKGVRIEEGSHINLQQTEFDVLDFTQILIKKIDTPQSNFPYYPVKEYILNSDGDFLLKAYEYTHPDEEYEVKNIAEYKHNDMNIDPKAAEILLELHWILEPFLAGLDEDTGEQDDEESLNMGTEQAGTESDDQASVGNNTPEEEAEWEKFREWMFDPQKEKTIPVTDDIYDKIAAAAMESFDADTEETFRGLKDAYEADEQRVKESIDYVSDDPEAKEALAWVSRYLNEASQESREVLRDPIEHVKDLTNILDKKILDSPAKLKGEKPGEYQVGFPIREDEYLVLSRGRKGENEWSKEVTLGLHTTAVMEGSPAKSIYYLISSDGDFRYMSVEYTEKNGSGELKETFEFDNDSLLISRESIEKLEELQQIIQTYLAE